MPMPKNCINCPACNEYLMCAIPRNGRGWNKNDVKDYSQSRPEWCPMKEQKKKINVQKGHTITFSRHDVFSWAGIYESIVQTLIDETALSISRYDDGNKVEFTWFLTGIEQS